MQRSVNQALDVYVRDLKTPPGLTVPDGHQCLCPAQSLVLFLAGRGPALSGFRLLDGPIRPALQLISPPVSSHSWQETLAKLPSQHKTQENCWGQLMDPVTSHQCCQGELCWPCGSCSAPFPDPKDAAGPLCALTRYWEYYILEGYHQPENNTVGHFRNHGRRKTMLSEKIRTTQVHV